MRTQEPESSSTTLTVRLKAEVKEQLARLSESTNRTRSYLAAEAIAAYVARESRIVEGIHQGLADMKAGRVVGHEAAMQELDAEIDAATKGK